ncbi:MAG: hypothetical protein EXS14_01660 [Planctomycetes bacterium]|nr:hypothetical protein [Planctomycetota bacterium]
MTRAAWAVLALACVAGVWLRLDHCSAAIEAGGRGINTSWYAGQAVKHFREFGFAATSGVPVLQGWPGTLDECVRYVSHPAPMTWLWWLGASVPGLPDELGLRLFPLLANLLTLPLCFFALRKHATPLAAATGTLVWATLPMSAYYGSIPSGESLLLPWLLLVWILHARWRAGVGRFAVLATVFALGCCLDWAFYWAAPALAAAAWAQGSFRTQTRALLTLLLLGVGAFGLYLVHMSWALGGTQEFSAQLQAALGAQRPAEAGLAAFLVAQWGFLRDLYGLPALVLAVLCLGTLSVPHGRRFAPFALFSGVVALLHVGLFHRHALDHDFWSIPLCLFFAIAGASLVDVVLERHRLVVVLLVIVCVGLPGALSTLALMEGRATDEFRRDIEALPSLQDENSVALVAPFWIQQVYYAQAHVFPAVDTVEEAQFYAAAYARVYAGAAHRPSLMAVLPPGAQKSADLQRLQDWLASLGIVPRREGLWDVWFLPGR